MTDAKRPLSARAVLLSLLGFVLLWAVVTDAWGYSSHLHFRGGAYVYAYASRIVWAAPAAALILRYGARLRFGKRDLLSRPGWDRSFAAALAASAVLAFGAMFALHGGLWIDRSVDPLPEIAKFVLVGVVEETVFRGWGYNALSAAVPEKKAVAYSTAFFVLLHWPAYFIKLYRFGTMDWSALLTQSLAAAIWGAVCCLLLKKGKTLWHPIAAHAFYDVLMTFFAG